MTKLIAITLLALLATGCVVVGNDGKSYECYPIGGVSYECIPLGPGGSVLESR